MKDIHETFGGLAGLKAVLDGRKTNRVFSGRSELASQCGRMPGFNNSDSYEDADRLMMTGDAGNARLLSDEKCRIERAQASVRTTCRDYVGFLPAVPAYLAGQPRNMINIRKSNRVAKKILAVTVNQVVGVNVAADDIIKAGAKILTAINALEMNDYRVNLNVCVASRTKEQTVAMTVSAKKAGEPLNLLKIAYPLVNPDFLRRHFFRYLETIPGQMSVRFRDGYGIPAINYGDISVYRIIKDGTSVQDIIDMILRTNK